MRSDAPRKRSAQNKAPGAMGNLHWEAFRKLRHHLSHHCHRKRPAPVWRLNATHHRELPLPAHYLLNIGRHRSLCLSRGLPKGPAGLISRSPIWKPQQRCPRFRLPSQHRRLQPIHCLPKRHLQHRAQAQTIAHSANKSGMPFRPRRSPRRALRGNGFPCCSPWCWWPSGVAAGTFGTRFSASPVPPWRRPCGHRRPPRPRCRLHRQRRVALSQLHRRRQAHRQTPRPNREFHRCCRRSFQSSRLSHRSRRHPPRAR